MNNHTDLLNYIAKKINAQSYLEIGVSNGKNFSQIDCPVKTGVDPDLKSAATIKKTSDEFFFDNRSMFDLVFIDGLHEAEQVKRDIENAFLLLNECGAIVIHDCNPINRAIAQYPRTTKEWCGNVWAAVSAISNHRFTVDFDYGCMVLRKQDGIGIGSPIDNWEQFDQNRKNLLNLVSVQDAIRIIDSWT